MLIRSKRHWATLLAVGLPLLVAGCAGGMGTPHGGPTAPPGANASHMDALAMADRLKAQGNFSSAAPMYQQAAQANPGDARALLGLGECFLAMGSNADAAQAYSAALASQPNNLDALRGLGHARILLGQPQFAVTQYQTALKAAPNDTRTLNGLGVAQDMMGDHVAAQKSYHQILTLDPANQSAKNNLALSMALAGDNAGGIKILEDVSKSAGATATNRQNLALLYGVSGQMAQAEQVSRADLPQDAVNRNMVAMSASGDAAQKQEMLKQALGVELKGQQYTPAAKPMTPLTNLAQNSALDDQPTYMTSQEGESLPVITTDKSGQTETRSQTQTAQSTDVVVKTTGKKDGWSDWDEELVDATDVNGTQTAAKPSPSAAISNITDTTAVVDGTGSPVHSQPSSQDAGAPRFLSSSNAIADDKPASTATPSKPAASSSASTTQMGAVPPTTTTPTDAEKPAAYASAATSTTSAEKPTTSAATTSAATSTAATAGAATTASTTASTPSSKSDVASSMTVTAKTMGAAKLYTVQIASYRSEQEASAGWQTLTAEQADLLAKLPHAVAKADLGAEKGVFYRLQAGSFSDRNDAKALCSDLKDHSIDCMVVEAAAPTSTQQSMLAPGDSFVIGAR